MAYLIKGAHVYNPDDLGVQDVLVVNDKIAAVGKNLTVVLPELETVDASGKILTPGFIDQHIHVTGGGGEGGPRSRPPEIVLSELISCGTTSLVGVSVTDSVNRVHKQLLLSADNPHGLCQNRLADGSCCFRRQDCIGRPSFFFPDNAECS